MLTPAFIVVHSTGGESLRHIQFVDHQSASLHGKRAIYLATDHSGLNKFRGPEDENFLLVRPEIKRMIQRAPQRAEEQYRCTVFLLYSPDFMFFKAPLTL